MRELAYAPLLFVAVVGCRSARAETEAPPAPPSAAARSAPSASPSAAPSATPLPSPSGAASAAPAAPASGCPPEMTRVGRSCLDRWEAHLVVRGADGSVTPYPANHRPEKGVSYEARSEPGVYPQAYVNRIESRAACEAAGKRLCSIAEWYRACRGPKGTTYPYGWHELRGKCNSGKAHLLSRMYGRDPRRWDYVKQFNDPALDVEPGFLAKTGEYSECTNERGAFDMVGNVHEWVSDIVDDQLEKKLPLQDDLRGRIPMNWGHGIFMGGFYSTTREHGEGCGFVTFGHEPAYHDYSTGFRCCKDAAP